MDRAIVHYSGHGDLQTGGWVVYDAGTSNECARITISEILDIANEEKYKGELEITSDCCYSGKQCYEAKDWW